MHPLYGISHIVNVGFIHGIHYIKYSQLIHQTKKVASISRAVHGSAAPHRTPFHVVKQRTEGHMYAIANATHGGTGECPRHDKGVQLLNYPGNVPKP